MELRFDGKNGSRKSKVKVEGFDAIVEMYENDSLVTTKSFTNWSEDTDQHRHSIRTAIDWLDGTYND